MYSKEEVKRLKEDFWTSYGQYMSVVPSADGERINWVNYKTGIKHLYFRMDADKKHAEICVEISHPDAGLRELIYDQFLELKSVFLQNVSGTWTWDKALYTSEGKQISKISCQLFDVSIFKRDDWPKLITFFKTHLIALDEFWSTAKYSFDIFK